MNLKHIIIGSAALLIFIYFLFFSGGSPIFNRDEVPIKSIAYNVTKIMGYTVYVKEGNSFEPYLVLTNKYNGYTLLLRKNILGSGRFNNYSSYYPGSTIDKSLNNGLIHVFSEELQNKIINTEITVTAKQSIGVDGEATEHINRKIFLLSATELGLNSGIATVEGKRLQYFFYAKRRIAMSNGQPSSWWLRSSYNDNDSSAWGIGPDGTAGGGGTDASNGIRPAFCVDGNTIIQKSVMGWKSVYILR